MKSTEIIKVSRSLDDIYKEIEQANKSGQFKTFIPHWVNVANETKLRLMSDGFKVYEGEWMRGDHGLIIEW